MVSVHKMENIDGISNVETATLNLLIFSCYFFTTRLHPLFVFTIQQHFLPHHHYYHLQTLAVTIHQRQSPQRYRPTHDILSPAKRAPPRYPQGCPLQVQASPLSCVGTLVAPLFLFLIAA